MSSKARKKPSQRGGAGPVAFFVALFIVALGTIQLASTFHTYALNLAELNGLKKQEAALVAQKRELENDIARWDDKAYVTAQARDRLGFVFPGEQAIRVEHPEAVTGKGGRILTDEFCRVKNQSNIFAIGEGTCIFLQAGGSVGSREGRLDETVAACRRRRQTGQSTTDWPIATGRSAAVRRRTGVTWT